MKIETPENFDDGITYVAPKMKTLKEKRQELLNKNIRFVDKTCKRLVLEIVEKQDKEFIEDILNEIEKLSKLRLYRSKSCQLFSRRITKIIKNKLGFEE